MELKKGKKPEVKDNTSAEEKQAKGPAKPTKWDILNSTGEI